jgi:hypothetical protein
MTARRLLSGVLASAALFVLLSGCDEDADGDSSGTRGASSGAGGGAAASAGSGGLLAGGKLGGGGLAGGAGPKSTGGAQAAGGLASPAAGGSTAGSGADSASGGKTNAGAAGTSGRSGGGTSAGASGDGGALSSGGADSNGEGGTDAGPGGASGARDPFGITELYPSVSPASEWTSEHWDGDAYEIDGRIDDNDPLAISGMRGTGSLEVTGTGELVMSGEQPRIYVYPGDGGPWTNVEITVYYQRVEDDATAYAGLVVGARSGEDGHTDATACDAHTYYARLRHDGAIDFEKELKHPASATRSRIQPETVWPPDGELPFDTWIGWKFVIYNLAAGAGVKLEAYRDLSGGANGGDWELMNETIDDGGWAVESDCDEHAPSGGESDLVVLDGGVSFIRNTGVSEARYRWFSVREIVGNLVEAAVTSRPSTLRRQQLPIGASLTQR